MFTLTRRKLITETYNNKNITYETSIELEMLNYYVPVWIIICKEKEQEGLKVRRKVQQILFES